MFADMSAERSNPICAEEKPNCSSKMPAQIGSTKYTDVPVPNRRQNSARDDAESALACARPAWCAKFASLGAGCLKLILSVR